MADIKEVSDGGSDPNTPTVEQMRKSQQLGSVGKGTNSLDYCQMQAEFAMGDGDSEATEKSSDYTEPWM